jgi:hypothetical protein
MGDNDFNLSISPFLSLPPIFNVALLRPYFPHMLNISEVIEQLAPKKLNLKCIVQAPMDRFMDTMMKETHQQNIQHYWVVKARQLLQ